MVELIALKDFRKHKKGDAFVAKEKQAKLLVAIKTARYLTRDMAAITVQPEIIVFDDASPQIEPKKRGRPARRKTDPIIVDSSTTE